MLISVVIPTRHRNDLLARCLEQLAPGRQTLAAGEYEVIVTDDGSESTAEEMIGTRFPWARWTAGPRRGPAANRNHGVRQARGEWIAFTDDDCVPSAGWLAAFVSALRPEVSVYEGRTTCLAGVKRFADDAPINLNGGTLPSCNFMISRRLFDQLRGFDESFLPNAAMEDVDFRERIRSDGSAMAFIAGATVDHPPRLRIRGARAGALWENRVYFEVKWHDRRQFGRWLPVFVLKVRLAEMLQSHRKRDYLPALYSMAGEVCHVVRHVRTWEMRYAGERSRE